MNIGSNCIKHYFKDFNRQPKDYDFVKHKYLEDFDIYKEALKTDKKIEVLDNLILINWIKSQYQSIPEYCPLNELYTLKISHAVGWDLENKSWDKHLWDIQFLKEKGCVFIPELFDGLYNYWVKVHGENKRSNLDMTADKFFNNAITFPIDHDTCHELLIKHPYFEGQTEPTYKKILIGEVDVCMDKFKKLSHKDKLKVVQEEVAIMGIEGRFPQKWYYKKKYVHMLKKFILNHAKLEEAVWIVQNHKELCNVPFDFEKHIYSFIKN